jgi:hypothetical protein
MSNAILKEIIINGYPYDTFGEPDTLYDDIILANDNEIILGVIDATLPYKIELIEETGTSITFPGRTPIFNYILMDTWGNGGSYRDRLTVTLRYEVNE